VSWERPFDQPVPLPNGAPARTLRDAANYIKKLPKSEHDSQEWRLAIHMLIEAAEDRGPMMFARMGILRAIERDAEPPQKRKEVASHGGGLNFNVPAQNVDPTAADFGPGRRQAPITRRGTSPAGA
jgi:hypothetical protein